MRLYIVSVHTVIMLIMDFEGKKDFISFLILLMKLMSIQLILQLK